MLTHHEKKIGIIASIVLAACAAFGTYYYYHHTADQIRIYDFNSVTDMQPMLDIFNKDFDWLTANKDCSPAFMFKNRTYDTNPIHFGSLKIKVLHESNNIAGFTAYYMESGAQGRLLS